MVHNKNRYFIISIIFSSVVFAIMLFVLFSLIHSIESNAIKKRNLNSMKSVSHMTEYIKFSIERPVMLLKGYEVYLMTNPELSEDETYDYLENLVGSDELVRNIGIIKGSTIVFNYPKEDNYKAIGIDLSKIPQQKDALNKVKITMKPLFFGPIELVQGGSGYIARTPIAVDGKYWGQVSIVLKADEVNRVFQDYAKGLNLEISLFQGSPSEKNLIFGDAGILNNNPIITTVSLIGSQYTMAAHEIKSEVVFDRYGLLFGFAFVFSLLLAFVVFLGFSKMNQIKIQASKDKLTQLHNRNHLEYFLKDVFNRAKNSEMKIGIVVMDIDDFKETNDTYGHLAGDAALKEISSSFLSTCRKTETVFRMGGDEFLIIFEDISSREAIEAISQRIISNLPPKIKYKDFEIPLAVSAGYALYPEDGEEFDVLFKHADDLMYKNKKDKKTHSNTR